MGINVSHIGPQQVCEKAAFLSDTLARLDEVVRTDPSVETSLANASFHESLLDTIDYATRLLEYPKWYRTVRADQLLKDLASREEVLKRCEATFKLSLMAQTSRGTVMYAVCVTCSLEQEKISAALGQVLALMQPGQHPFWLRHFRADTRIECVLTHFCPHISPQKVCACTRTLR